MEFAYCGDTEPKIALAIIGMVEMMPRYKPLKSTNRLIHLIQIIGSRLAGANALDKAAVLLQIFGSSAALKVMAE